LSSNKTCLNRLVETLGLADGGGSPVDDREVTGVYCGDLLSDVMGQAHPGEIWVTVQSHMNVVAVAALKELAAVVICGDHRPEETAAEKARDEDVVLLCTECSPFEVCGLLWEQGLRRAC